MNNVQLYISSTSHSERSCWCLAVFCSGSFYTMEIIKNYKSRRSFSFFLLPSLLPSHPSFPSHLCSPFFHPFLPSFKSWLVNSYEHTTANNANDHRDKAQSWTKKNPNGICLWAHSAGPLIVPWLPPCSPWHHHPGSHLMSARKSQGPGDSACSFRSCVPSCGADSRGASSS